MAIRYSLCSGYDECTASTSQAQYFCTSWYLVSVSCYVPIQWLMVTHTRGQNCVPDNEHSQKVSLV